MVTKKTRYFEINVRPSGFVSRFTENKKHNFQDMKILRNLLSNEKARILYTLKTKSPDSIYKLAKLIKRDLKSVRKDIKILEKYGFIEIVSKKTGNRISHTPTLAIDKMEFSLSI